MKSSAGGASDRPGTSIGTKVSTLLGILIVLILAQVVTAGLLARNLSSNIAALKNRDTLFEQSLRQANDSFLTMDDQSNMWVGLYQQPKSSQLVTQTLSQIQTSEKQVQQSLQAAEKYTATPQEKSLISQALKDSQSYNNYFSQVYQYNYTDHTKAAQIMYVNNASASNALNSDLAKLEQLAEQRLLDHATAASSRSTTSFLISTAVGALVFLLSIVTLFFIRRVLRPIPTIAATLGRIADGDLTVPTVEVKSRDEMGLLARSANHMLEQLVDLIGKVSHSSQQVAASSEELSASAEETSKATNQVALSAQAVANGSDAQVRAATESARAMTEVATGVQRVADTSSTVTEASVEMRQTAESGAEAVNRAVKQMNAIHESVDASLHQLRLLNDRSTQISTIVAAITAISSQTNLLALNATIEAARAGEHGRGFAVVADEVRKLAEQSATSAQEIIEIVEKMREGTAHSVSSMDEVKRETETGREVVGQAGQAFSAIVAKVKDVSQQIMEVSAAAEEISASSQQVTASIQEMANISRHAGEQVQTVAASTEEQLASMEEISASSAELSHLAEELQGLVSTFRLN